MVAIVQLHDHGVHDRSDGGLRNFIADQIGGKVGILDQTIERVAEIDKGAERHVASDAPSNWVAYSQSLLESLPFVIGYGGPESFGVVFVTALARSERIHRTMIALEIAPYRCS